MGVRILIGSVWVYVLGLLVLLSIPLLIWVIRRIQMENWKDKAGLGNLGALTDPQFDDWVENLFEKMGYQVAQASGRESLGVDWILTDPRGNRTALQTRRWRQDVGPEGVEQIVGGAVFHRCDERLVITTATFTYEARRLGRQTETRLWGLRELTGALEAARTGAPPTRSGPAPKTAQAKSEPAAKVGPAVQAQGTAAGRAADLVAVANQSEAALKCPRCGKAMIRRSVNGRGVLVCLDFPRCTGARVEMER